MIAEHVIKRERQLSEKQEHIEQSDFQMTMMRKELGLLIVDKGETENHHPNSPSVKLRGQISITSPRAALRPVLG